MKLAVNNLSKKDFLAINEDDVMFITNPGRMGDVDGSTFIIKKDNEYITYRIDGLMYGNRTITLTDMFKHFPKWRESIDNWTNKEYIGKYTCIYMGFGNGLSVDNSLFNEFKPFLDKRVESYLAKVSDKEGLKYAAIYNTWEDAFIDMINDKSRSKKLEIVND